MDIDNQDQEEALGGGYGVWTSAPGIITPSLSRTTSNFSLPYGGTPVDRAGSLMPTPSEQEEEIVESMLLPSENRISENCIPSGSHGHSASLSRSASPSRGRSISLSYGQGVDDLHFRQSENAVSSSPSSGETTPTGFKQVGGHRRKRQGDDTPGTMPQPKRRHHGHIQTRAEEIAELKRKLEKLEQERRSGYQTEVQRIEKEGAKRVKMEVKRAQAEKEGEIARLEHRYARLQVSTHKQNILQRTQQVAPRNTHLRKTLWGSMEEMEEPEEISQSATDGHPTVMPDISPELIELIAEEVCKRLNIGKSSKQQKGQGSNEDPEERAIMLALTRWVFRNTFGIEQDDDFVNHRSASSRRVRAYNEGEGEGPDPRDLHFDMRSGPDTPWNSTIIHILIGCAQEKAQELAHVPERSNEYIEKMVSEKFQRCRAKWKFSQPRTDESGELETPEEVQQRIDESKQGMLKAQRHNTRRNQRWHRRMKMLEAMTEEIATDDVKIYEWLQDVMKTLGKEGTSSDESSVEEDGTVVYTVKQLPWRRNIDKEISIIDSLRTQEPSLFTTRGARPIKRQRGANNLIVAVGSRLLTSHSAG